MSCCNCNKKNLIRTVQKYNLLIRLSERLFDKSEELLNKTVRKEILRPLKHYVMQVELMIRQEHVSV